MLFLIKKEVPGDIACKPTFHHYSNKGVMPTPKTRSNKGQYYLNCCYFQWYQTQQIRRSVLNATVPFYSPSHLANQRFVFVFVKYSPLTLCYKHLIQKPPLLWFQVHSQTTLGCSAGFFCRSQVTCHCFSNTESIPNACKS